MFVAPQLSPWRVQADYSRLHGMFARDVVNAPSCRPAALPAKVCGYLNASLRPLILDPDLLGTSAVAANVHACAAYAAIKMHCCLRSMRERGAAGRSAQRSTQRSTHTPALSGRDAMPQPGRPEATSVDGSRRTALPHGGRAMDFSKLAMAVLESVRAYIVHTCMRCWASLPDPNPQPRLPAKAAAGSTDEPPGLGVADLELLTLTAFRKVLLRKHATYNEAVAEIGRALRQRRLRRRAASWEHVIAPQDRLPVALRGIKW